MCLFTDNPRPKVAKTPIKVWKRLLSMGIIATNKTKTNKIEIYVTPYQHIWVKSGDSLKALDNNAKVQEASILRSYVIGEQGVHGYVTKPTAKFFKHLNEVITEWEIPVGAKYWLGNYCSKGEIAATEMKFVKTCKD